MSRHPDPRDLSRIDASPHVTPERYITHDTPGIGGELKQRPEDFIVDELPLYEPSGQGEHIYLFIEKRGVTGMELARLLARHFRVGRKSIGYAGMKDKMAVTRQVVSVHAPGRRIEDFPHLQHPNISVLWADYHDTKLRRGHLAGNRFSIRVRGVEMTAALVAKKMLDRLAETGAPNRYGPQRFGYLLNNHLVGRAIILNRYQEAANLLLGPSGLVPEGQTEARQLVQEGDFAAASKAFHPAFRTEKALCAALANGESVEHAISTMEQSVTGYYISAFQSAVFNAVLDQRLQEGTPSSFVPGDVVIKPSGHGRRVVEEVDLSDGDLVEKAKAFELLPSGPLWGRSMSRAAGRIDEMEVGALARLGVQPEDLQLAERLDAEMIGGSRRPLVMALQNQEVEGGIDEHGAYVRCAFDLPRGGFATTVMAEIMKPDQHGEPEAQPDLTAFLTEEHGA